MKNRRDFIKKFSALTGLAATIPISSSALSKTSSTFNSLLLEDIPAEGADNEDFWAWVQQSYTASPNFINLNNGGVSPQPIIVQEAFKRYMDICNEAPSYYMWREFNRDVKAVKEKLAKLAGVTADTIAINRNTTEALDTIINGLPLKKVDEVALSVFDYPNMKNVWKMREKRDGILLKWVTFPAPCNDEDFLVEQYVKAMTPKTKLVHITHLINWTGQVLPARKIADKAKEKGIEVLVDGAHSFAHIDFKISDLNCDYFGTSLHKWLCAPFGTGLMYVHPSKIKKLWPYFPSEEPDGNKMNKMENLGTHNIPAKMAIGQAINFHLLIGAQRKQRRLFELKQYWIDKIKDDKRFVFYTPQDAKYSGAIATVGIIGQSGPEISRKLQKLAQIHTTNVQVENVDGVRVTPHIYTRFQDLDRLVEGLLKIASE